MRCCFIFIMPSKAEFYQSPGELARCVCLDKKTDFKDKQRQSGQSLKAHGYCNLSNKIGLENNNLLARVLEPVYVKKPAKRTT